MTKQNLLSARVAQMDTKEIKRTLWTMNLKPSPRWTSDECMVETYLVGELCDRGEAAYVTWYEAQISK